jgi:hypothetical protein
LREAGIGLGNDYFNVPENQVNVTVCRVSGSLPYPEVYLFAESGEKLMSMFEFHFFIEENMCSKFMFFNMNG